MVLPTLRDVAELAGVSMSTVSRVLNERGGVTADKRIRVERALTQLDYVSNVSARSLRGTRSRTYALLVDDLASVFFSELAESLTRIALERGCTLLIVTTQKAYERERRIITDMRARQVDGLFVVAASGDDTGHRGRNPSAIPVVYVERFPPGVDADVVTFDYYQAGLDQIDRLWAAGHRRIAFLGGNITEDPGRRRLAAFRDGIRTHGLIPDPELISTGHLSEASAEPAVDHLRLLADPPTAVVVTVAPLLRTTLRIAAEHDWAISIASYESVDTPELTPVQLYVTDTDLDELARTAADILRARIETATDPGDTPSSGNGAGAPPAARTVLIPTMISGYRPLSARSS
jgi:LacI family transcriptional regulator